MAVSVEESIERRRRMIEPLLLAAAPKRRSRGPLTPPPAPPPRSYGLGDLAEAFFISMGASEERYRAVKKKLLLDPHCHCADRKAWLNAVGRELGVDNAVAKFFHWREGAR